MTIELLCDWREVWTHGIAPELTHASLVQLAAALRRDDPAVIQGATVRGVDYDPQATVRNLDAPPACACPLGFALWQGEGLETVFSVEARFADVAVNALKRMEQRAGHAWVGIPPISIFAGFVDHSARDTMRMLLLEAIEERLPRHGAA